VITQVLIRERQGEIGLQKKARCYEHYRWRKEPRTKECKECSSRSWKSKERDFPHKGS